MTKHTKKTSNVTKLRMWQNSKIEIWQLKTENATKNTKKKPENVRKFINLRCEKIQNSECDIPQQFKMWQN